MGNLSVIWKMGNGVIGGYRNTLELYHPALGSQKYFLLDFTL